MQPEGSLCVQNSPLLLLILIELDPLRAIPDYLFYHPFEYHPIFQVVPFRFPLQAQYAVRFSHLRFHLIPYVHYVFQYLKEKGENREVDKRCQQDRQLNDYV